MAGYLSRSKMDNRERRASEMGGGAFSLALIASFLNIDPPGLKEEQGREEIRSFLSSTLVHGRVENGARGRGYLGKGTPLVAGRMGFI